MKCNVCGLENRCYLLREVNGHPGMLMRGEGMIFTICASCLTKLVAPIKTDATTVETPEDIPVDNPRVVSMMDRIVQQHDTKKPPKIEKPPKPTP